MTEKLNEEDPFLINKVENPIKEIKTIDVVDKSKINLSISEQNNLIRKYSSLDLLIKAKEDCFIGVGYSTCEDIGFRAKDLFAAIDQEIKELGEI